MIYGDVGFGALSLLDPYLVNASHRTLEYLRSLDAETFLYSFYRNAGLTPTTASGYGGWERETGQRFQGHFFGHYLSALAQAHSGGQGSSEVDFCAAQLAAAVDGLRRCQEAYAIIDPSNAGYVSAFPVGALPAGADGLLVPFYNLHKIVAGLVQVAERAPEETARTALAVASAFADWLDGWVSRQDDPTALLQTEYGGMNDALYDLYRLTRRPEHRRAAEAFDEVSLFRNLAAGRDVLDGLHANTTIPKVLGALKRYTVHAGDDELLGRLSEEQRAELPMYRSAAENFWRMVVDHHSYANGGNSQSEHFHEPDSVRAHATNGIVTGYGENSTVEGCNEYNMLKLARELFMTTGRPEYADYYEWTYTNCIVASQNPETGMVTYFQPMAPGYAKVFGNEQDEFWCDHGTGIESFTKLGDSVYYRSGRALFVAMFRSSQLSLDDVGLTLTQDADLPVRDLVTFTIAAAPGRVTPQPLELRLRIPSWVAGMPELTRNGRPVDIGGSLESRVITLVVRAGDELAYRLPSAVAVDESAGADWVAFSYGPVLLATEFATPEPPADYVAGVLVRMSIRDATLDADIHVHDAAGWKAGLAEHVIREECDDGSLSFALRAVDAVASSRRLVPYFSLYRSRYAIYSTLIESGEL